jgi:uncharacterized protein (UPF0332 family)
VVHLLDKAKSFAQAATIMLASGYPDAAAGEAYYSMFNAARALLEALGSPAEIIKSHGATIGQFGARVIRTGLMDRKFGRLLNKAQELRTTADYDVISIDERDVEEYVKGAYEFIEEVLKCMPSGSAPADFHLPDPQIALAEAKTRLETGIEAKERLRGAANLLVAVARGRGHQVPGHFTEKLMIYGDEALLLRMAAHIDDMGDDVIEFARRQGLDIPSYET